MLAVYHHHLLPTQSQLSSSTTSSRGVSKQVKPTLNYANNNNIPNLNSNILHIKITSHVVGQLVPVSSNLLVTGTSSDTASFLYPSIIKKY
jgi:hypothetical protein